MNCRLFLVGRKGYELFKRRPSDNISMDYFPELLSHPESDAIRLAAKNFLSFYNNNAIDERLLVYTGSVSALERRIEVQENRFPSVSGLIRARTNTILERRSISEFDPSPDVILNSLIPRYIEGMFLRGILESSAAEQGARMVAMGAMTDRAEEMISDMTSSTTAFARQPSPRNFLK